MPVSFAFFLIAGFLLRLCLSSVLVSLAAGGITYLISRFRSLKPANPRSAVKKVAFIAFLVSLCSQITIPWVAVALNSLPPAESLPGTWVPTKPSLERIADAGLPFANHRITLHQDGTLSMTDIPSAWISSTVDTGSDFYSGHGTWEIVNVGRDRYIQILLEPMQAPFQLIWLSGINLIYFQLNSAESASFEKCGNPSLRITDPELAPIREALNNSDRIALGFSPISPQEHIEIEGTIGEQEVRLQVYGDTTRYIVFKKIGTSYQWVYEQEKHQGMDRWTDYDAAQHVETITVQYQIESITGLPLNTIWVSLVRRNSDGTGLEGSTSADGLMLEDVLPVIEEWRIWRSSQPPEPFLLCP